MSLLIAALIALVALAIRGEPGGWLWRLFVELPARKLGAMTWRQMAAAVIVAAFAIFAAELIVTRLLPSWRGFKAEVGRIVQPDAQARPRSSRARRVRRPAAKPSDDPDPVWVPAFA